MLERVVEDLIVPYGKRSLGDRCKHKCEEYKAKQHTGLNKINYNKVYCSTCGIYINLSFIKPRKGSGFSCMCCNQRVRFNPTRKSGLK